MSTEQQLDLSTTDGIVAYLANTPFASDNVASLSGGNGNFTYHVHLRTPHEGVSDVVVKYAPPYVAVSRGRMPFDVERQRYEVAAMKVVKSILPNDGIVTIPRIHLFDEAAHVIIMEHCGEGILTLKQLMLQDPPPISIARDIGKGLGEFLGHLHTWGLDPDASNHAYFDTNQQGKTMSGFVTYGRLVSTLTGKDKLPALTDPSIEVPQSKIDIISGIATKTIDAVNTSHQTLTMGDFWPGNILVRLSAPSGESDLRSLERIYVLDWELSKPGLAGLDIGQFTAEMHLLRRFSPASDESVSTALSSFFKSYQASFPAVDEELARIAVVHVGAHLVAWTPRVPWGGKERTRQVVLEGVDCLVNGCQETRHWLEKSIVGPLL